MIEALKPHLNSQQQNDLEECACFLRVKNQSGVDKLRKALKKGEEDFPRLMWQLPSRQREMLPDWSVLAGDFEIGLRLNFGMDLNTTNVDWTHLQLLSEQTFEARVGVTARAVCDAITQGRAADIKEYLLFPFGERGPVYKSSPEKLVFDLVECGPHAEEQLPQLLQKNHITRPLGFSYFAALRAWQWGRVDLSEMLLLQDRVDLNQWTSGMRNKWRMYAGAIDALSLINQATLATDREKQLQLAAQGILKQLQVSIDADGDDESYRYLCRYFNATVALSIYFKFDEKWAREACTFYLGVALNNKWHPVLQRAVEWNAWHLDPAQAGLPSQERLREIYREEMDRLKAQRLATAERKRKKAQKLPQNTENS